jgi:putative tricarboxylic transport membrane protein
MGDWSQLAAGFQTALAPENLLFCFVGVFIGTLIGVLPGIGPVSSIALLLPFTFSLSPTSGLIMLAGIYYGSQYGGSTTAILANLPGEASSAVTCLDGYVMARQGRAGLALAIAAIASFIAGTFGTLLLACLSAPLASLAANFQAADYVCLIIAGLIAAIVMARGPVIKSAAMVLLGLMLGTVGTNVVTAHPRFTLGIPELADGIGFLPLAIGLLGLSEIIDALASPVERTAMKNRAGGGFNPGEKLRAFLATLRGTALGSFFGVLPGGGAVISSFAAYALEKKLSRSDPRVGSGAVEGVAAPEAANNAAAQTSFIPLLTLGLPANPVMAMFVGALVIHGIQPGPEIIVKQPGLFWGLIASMWIGNALLLALNLPLVGMWAKLLCVPKHFLFPGTVVLSCVGIYSLNHSGVELLITAGFGVFGFFLRRLGFEPAPLLLGFVLSNPLEGNLHRALLFANGDATTFLRHPIGASLLVASVIFLVVAALPGFGRVRAELR